MVALRCILLRDTFEGSHADAPSEAEWPPSWMRLYSALVSVADHSSEEELLLLETIERWPAPIIHADPPTFAETPQMSFRRTAWVPQNTIANGGSGALVGRVNGERSWSRFVPRSRSILYAWPQVEVSPERAARLDSLSRRVPYLGRTTSPAIVEFVRDCDVPPGATYPATHVSAEDEFIPTHAVRVPFAGALRALEDAYERKERGQPGDSWAIGAFSDYGVLSRAGEPSEARGPYRDFVVLALDGPRRDGRHAVELTNLLRKSVMANLARPLPAVHGHGTRGTVQCAFLALPFVGREHADGHVVGLAVAIPEMNRLDLADLHAAIGAVASRGLSSASLGSFRLRRLSPLDLRRAPAALQTWRWMLPSTTWVTAYPVVLDRYLRPNDTLDTLVRRTVQNAGLPEPEFVMASLQPFTNLVPGALSLTPGETTRPGHGQGVRPYRHLVLTFPAPVRGPVILGSMRHYGLGLCVPIPRPQV